MDIVDASAFEPDKDPMPDAYRDFRDRQDVPVHTGLYIKDLNALETDAWDLTGQNGALINLYGTDGVDDLHLHEIQPGGKTTTQQHFYEEIVYVLEGRGSSIIGEDHQFEWEEGSLFFIPHNAPYTHFNLSDDTPARLVSQTSLPQYLNMIEDESFIFDSGYVPDLDEGFFSSEGTESRVFEGKYSGEGTQSGGAFQWVANFIPDIRAFDKIKPFKQTGSVKVAFIPFPTSSARAHIAEVPGLMYKNAHRHQPGSHVFMLSSEGYSLLWKEGWDEKYRVDWQPGSVFPPGSYWYHQHFVLSEEGARSLAMHPHRVGTLHNYGVFDAHDPVNIVNYAREDPAIRALFERELASRGLESKMPDACYRDPNYDFYAGEA